MSRLVLVVCAAFGCPVSRAAPIPTDCVPLERNRVEDLELGLAAPGKLVFGPGGERGRSRLRLTLTNGSSNGRELADLQTVDNRLDDVTGVQFVARFPGGEVVILHPYPLNRGQKVRPDGADPAPAPRALSLKPNESATGTIDLVNSYTPEFHEQYDRAAGRFCLTAIVPGLGLRSDTVTYNGCPDPPRSYDACAEAARLEEAVLRRREALQQQIIDRKAAEPR